MLSLRQIQRSVASASTAAPPIYMAEYSRADGTEFPSMDISKYPGLLFFHEIRSSSGAARLIACWSTRDHFVRDGVRFAAELSAVLVENHGFLANPRFQRGAAWKRIRLHTALITIAAIIGAMQVIGGTYNWLFVTPDLELKAAASRFSAVEGQPLKQALELINHLPTPHRNIALRGTLRDTSGTNHNVPIQPALFPHIAPGESQTVDIATVPPAAGKYQLVIQARASAGRLAAAKTFDLVRDVTVWPEQPIAQLAIGDVRHDVAFVSGSLAIGPPAAHGLECELEIPRVSALHFTDIFEFPYLDGKPDWRTVETPGHEDAVLSWNTGSIDGERSVEFSLALLRQGATDWNSVLRQTELRCQYRRSKDYVP
jgi:hypothetical protein